jgi:hypothetical protein
MLYAFSNLSSRLTKLDGGLNHVSWYLWLF